ncbi:M81 family metallopeptidase, partial [Acinetobacter baumannii]
LYAQLERVDALDGVLEASLFVGYARADEPRAAAGAIVTGTDAAVVRREAARLAQQYWDARTVFRYGVPTGSLADCFDRADASPTRPVIVADS